MARPLPKRWTWIVAGVAAVTLIVVAAVLSSRDDGGMSAGNGESEATAESTASAGATATASATGTAQPGTPGSTAPGTTGTTPGTAPSGTAGAATGSQHVPPTAPAAEGAALATVTTPPAQTLAMIDATKATAESKYTVTFQVFGYGPGGGTGSLVITVRKSTPVGTVEKPYEFTGRNVLARLAPGSAGQVTVGGTYDGMITLKPDGSVLVPVLSDVRKGS